MKIDRWIGLLALLFCGALLFLWIPLDVETGIVEKVRRQVRLGDAFAPSLAALLIGLGGLLLLLHRSKNNTETRSSHTGSKGPQSEKVVSNASKEDHLLRGADFQHACIVLVVTVIVLMVMRYAGPLALQLIEGSESEYRLLRDTIPWKYIGFSLGGILLVTSLISYIEGRLRAVHCLVAVVVVVLLIAFYDLPFEDLLLPPNGDV